MIDQQVQLPTTIVNGKKLSYHQRIDRSINDLRLHSKDQRQFFQILLKAFSDFYKNYLDIIQRSLFRGAKIIRFFEVAILNEQNILDDMWMDRFQKLADKTLVS